MAIKGVIPLYCNELGYDLATNPHLSSLQATMMYRHLYAHNSGLLDDDYINQLKRGEAVAKAATVLRPSLNAAATIHHVSKSDFGELYLESLFNSLSDQVEQVNQGNLERLEALLVAQAHTLDAIFNSLVRRAA